MMDHVLRTVRNRADPSRSRICCLTQIKTTCRSVGDNCQALDDKFPPSSGHKVRAAVSSRSWRAFPLGTDAKNRQFPLFRENAAAKLGL